MKINLANRPLFWGASMFIILSTLLYFIHQKPTQVEVPSAQLVKDREGLWQRSLEIANMEFLKTRDPNLDAIPKQRLMDAKKYKDEMIQELLPGGRLAAAPIAGVVWNERGPTNVSGRIRAILVDANDATGNTVIAGGVGGGVWRTTDALAANPTWNKINDFFDNLAVVSIAQDPSNLNNIYFGTGEGFFNVDAIQGLGIWQSTDGGLTFNQLPSTNNATFFWVNDIEIAANGDIFAATRTGGLQYSNDGGASWNNILTTSTILGGAAVNFPTNSFGDVEIAPNGDIYAMGGVIFTTDGIYKSTDGGSTWVFLHNGTNNLPTAGYERIELAIAPSNSNRLYALFQSSTNNGCNNILSSDNAGCDLDCKDGTYDK